MSKSIKALVAFANPYSKYGLFRNYCNFTNRGELVTAANHTQDFLLQNVRNAPSSQQVLQLISQHYDIMNTKHIMQALRTVFDLQKQGNSNLSTKQIIQHPGFEKLCRKLKTQAGIIDLQETVEALKVISFFGAKSDSQIVQTLLQLIRQNINSLNLHHIIFLEFLLAQFKPTPLVQALQIALPLVFDIHLPLKMDRDNIHHVTEYLQYASRTAISPKSLDLILSSLERSNVDFEPKLAKSIIWSLTDLPPDLRYEPLLNKAINNLIVHLDEVKYQDMESTLTRLIAQYSTRFPFYYNEVFFDSCANYVIDNDVGFDEAIYILRKFGRIAHVNNHLVDYITRKALADPSLILNASSPFIYSIVVSISMTDYRPPNWSELKELIEQCRNLGECDKREIIWLKFASALCLLGIFKIDVITKAFALNNGKYLFSRRFMSDIENYVTIWQGITYYKPELSELLPPKYTPESLSELHKIMQFPLENALHKALGGENYVWSNLTSKVTPNIDHAVLFRKGGFPVAINPDIKNVEDIPVTADSQLVLILCLRPIHYTLNGKNLKGSHSLTIKLLENNGFTVVPISLQVWECLSDFERIPFIMQAINTKVASDFSNTEYVSQFC